MAEPALLVELRNVTFSYGERVILRDVSLQVPRGKVTALMGASGGGKTTVLRLIGGQQRAQQGQVLFDGQDVGAMAREQLFAVRRRMGMLFQFGALFTDMSVFENVAFPLREHTDLPDELVRDIVLMKLHAVGLRGAPGEFRHHSPWSCVARSTSSKLVTPAATAGSLRVNACASSSLPASTCGSDAPRAGPGHPPGRTSCSPSSDFSPAASARPPSTGSRPPLCHDSRLPSEPPTSPSIFSVTASTTTIASSTTIPIASTRPNSDKVLMENPIA